MGEITYVVRSEATMQRGTMPAGVTSSAPFLLLAAAK